MSNFLAKNGDKNLPCANITTNPLKFVAVENCTSPGDCCCVA
jgi:hypothetical protein